MGNKVKFRKDEQVFVVTRKDGSVVLLGRAYDGDIDAISETVKSIGLNFTRENITELVAYGEDDITTLPGAEVPQLVVASLYPAPDGSGEHYPPLISYVSATAYHDEDEGPVLPVDVQFNDGGKTPFVGEPEPKWGEDEFPEPLSVEPWDFDVEPPTAPFVGEEKKADPEPLLITISRGDLSATFTDAEFIQVFIADTYA